MPAHVERRVSTRLWGERGLVSSLFLDLAAEGTLDRWEQFLRALTPAVPSEGLAAAMAVVEPDFGNKGFGHPDAAARLDYADGTRCVLIVEAKMTTCERSSCPRNRRGARGFNSRLNGQVELNHRLALALSTFDPDVQDTLREELAAASEYSAFGGARILKSRLVLERLVAPLAGLDLPRYRHVVISTDQGSPWSSFPPTLAPLILVNGDDQPEFLKQQLHWTNWRSISELARDWEGSAFADNYDFHRPTPGRDTQAPAGVNLLPGVYLVELSDSIDSRRTCVRLSWRGRSFRLRDYSGRGTEDVRPACDLETLLTGGIRRHKRYREHVRWQNHEWWHRETLKCNAEWGLG